MTRWKMLAGGGVAAAVLLGVPVAVNAATTDPAATCSPAPAITTGAASDSFTVTCSYPRPAPVTSTVTTTVTAPAQTVTVTASPAPVSQPLLTGFRANDLSFDQANALIGPAKVTRLFYSGQLPTTYTRQGIPAGVKLIVSYKQPGNTAAYLKSIPAGEDVELAYHHEPEGDYSSGATFVSEFDAEADVAHAANPAVPFAFIAGAYQYRAKGTGYDGSFVPTKQDRNYLDSYWRGLDMQPAQADPRVQRYIALLEQRGKHWDGYTEYGRGVIAKGASFDQAVADKRVQTIQADKTYLPTLGIKVWAYWYTTDLASGDQWRFTDNASIGAWRS